MRILLTRYGGIGDLIYIEPVIRAIKEKYNPTEIIFRTCKDYNCGEVTVQPKEVFKENPFISAVVFDNNRYELGIETFGLCVENLVPKNLEKWGSVNPYFDMHINFQGAIEKNINNPNLHAVDMFANAANVKVKDRIPKIYYDQKIVPKYELVVQLKSAEEDRNLSKNNDLIEIISKSNLTKVFLGEENLNYHEFISIIANCKIFIGTESCGFLIATGLNKKVITIFKNEIRVKNLSYENAMNITKNEIVKFKSEILNYITKDEKMNETSKCLESKKTPVIIDDPSVINIVDKNKLIDIVIVSYAKNEYCESLTRDCINSLLLSEPNAESIFNIIVVESNPSVKWEKMSPCVVTYEAVLPYGYHKFLNYGRKKGNSEWVALCNNDLQFTEGWFSKILQASSIDPSVLSFSPLCPLTQANLANKGLVYGYQVRQEISGWCIVQKRSIYNIIGDLDEDFYHWNCDSDYSMTLFKNDIKHVLVTDSVVIHHNQNIGKTTESIVESDSEMHRLTIGCRSIFNKKYPIIINKETLTRYDIINKIIELNSYANYLEIGINNGLCFKKINCSKKTGVDPNSDHATCKMTSDDFFKTLKPEDKFDIIFIDGLHLEMQVDKDIENSIKYLKENGTIILHDCNPPSEYHAKENIYFGGPISGEWNGTVYKSLVKIRSKRNDLTLTTVDTDYGVGILTKEPSETIKTCSDTWDFFDANRKEILNLITPKQFEKIYNKSKKIGLCMIVKNESKIIERCLNSVKPLIDYVCIIDTGSTDDTVNVINNWMKSNDVDGEVVFEPWKDFAYNRSFAMKKIREKKYIDYALMIDADEILMYEEGINFLKIKENLNCDLYNITCKLGNIEYARTSITKNNMPYFYKGVVHEYLECEEHIKTRETIKGIYNIPFQDSARNQNIEKYQHDANVLQDTLKIETDPFLISRYTFYLAQSYRDSLEKEKAIYWYNKRSKLGFWDQEIYISLYKVAKLKEELEYPEDDIIQSYMRAYEICPERIEAIHGAVSFCRRHGRNHQAYTLSKHAISMPVNKTGLFSENWIWDYGIHDEFTISCYWSGHYKEGLEVSEKLINKIPEEQKERILKNIGYLKEKLNSK